jgi:hypothetical protein
MPKPSFVNPFGSTKADKMHEECGVSAVFGSPDAARLVYLSLYALQHRGQEAAGIVTSNGSGMHSKISMGLVGDIFDKPTLDQLTGNHAIGHVRYSTAGGSKIQNCQPIIANTGNGRLAVAHNGNLTNAIQLSKPPRIPKWFYISSPNPKRPVLCGRSWTRFGVWKGRIPLCSSRRRGFWRLGTRMAFVRFPWAGSGKRGSWLPKRAPLI